MPAINAISLSFKNLSSIQSFFSKEEDKKRMICDQIALDHISNIVQKSQFELELIR